MKRIFVPILLLLTLNASARNFYFSASGSDSYTTAQAQNPATPWKSLAKLNSFFSSLLPGDSVLLKRGDTFYGKIFATKSGTSSAPIVIAAYGGGAMPVVTGFTTVRDWVALGGGVWESAAAVSTLPTCNIVTVDGINTAMGRYPDADAAREGYLMPDANGGTGGTNITDQELPDAGTINFSNSEMVIRRSRFQLFRYNITGHSGKTITYSPAYAFGTDKGYFVQNHPATVTRQSEWYYNPGTKRLRMHFGTSNPNSFVVKASTLDTLVFANNLSYLTFTGIDIQGSNDYSFLSYSATANNIINCVIRYAGRNAIRQGAARECIVRNTTIEDIGSNGISMTVDGSNGNSYSGYTIEDNNLRRIGVVRGAGLDEDNKYNAISTTGSNVTIQRNFIDSVGYAGILFSSHNDILIKNNTIEHYCWIIDDGGAIYTAQHASTFKTLTNRRVEGNTILNSGDPRAGLTTTNGAAYGVYCDDGASGVDIINNTVAFVSHEAYYIHNAFNITMRGNTAFGFPSAALRLIHNGTQYPKIRGIDIKHNTFVAREASASEAQAMVYAQTDATDPDFSLWGMIDSNNYVSAVDFTKLFKHRKPNDDAFISFASWKSKTTWDDNSTVSAKSFTGATNPLDSFRFEYNATAQPITVGLDRSYVNAKGTVYNATITLQPYSSAVLLANGPGGVVSNPGGGTGGGPGETGGNTGGCPPTAVSANGKTYVIKVGNKQYTIKLCN